MAFNSYACAVKFHSEYLTARILALGAFITTIIVITNSVSDPVNTPKFFTLGLTSLCVFGCVLGTNKNYLARFSIYEFLIVGFICWALISTFASYSPISQNMYGVYGRNTGFLTYLFLGVLALSAASFSYNKAGNIIVYSFVASGIVNIVYSCWVVVLGDFVSWNNPYGAILGTFGNPNFVSSFLGILFGVLFAGILILNKKIKIILGFTELLIFLLLFHADSIQGFIVAIVGVWVCIAIWFLKKAYLSKLLPFFLLINTIILSVISLGVFKIGPLAWLFQEETLTLRKQYWFAAWQMAAKNPVFGVGMDSYGDWYRRSRGSEALISPGPETVTNAAHNIYLDILAYGGFPLLIFYLGLMAITFKNIIKLLKSPGEIDFVVVALIIIWVGYHSQAAVSINQIGLGIWGWLSSGFLISYGRGLKNPVLTEKQMSNPRNTKKLDSIKSAKLTIAGSLGLLLGFVVAFPPLNADLRWAYSLRVQQLDALQTALTPGYFNPPNSYRLAQAVQLLERNNFHKEAVYYARKGVEFNPDYDDAWEMLYFAKEANSQEKNLAKENLIRLDPLNPKWKNLD